ncbi:MAG: alpha/beta hydrolase [Terracidiphilus sp.]|nr:alpha/beta hydrolase [Terracidiphilus sp.]
MRDVALLDANIPSITLHPTITLGPDNWRNWHFLFNPIPDLAEALLQRRERILIEWFFNRKAADPTRTFSQWDIDEYMRVYSSLGGMRRMLGYYRGVLENMKSGLANLRLGMPLLPLGGDEGSAPDLDESLQLYCIKTQGGVIEKSGHYIPQEQPEALARELISSMNGLSA